MEAILSLRWLNGRAVGLIIALIVVGGAFAVLISLGPEQQRAVLYFAQDYLPIAMFATLGTLLFSGYRSRSCSAAWRCSTA
jgi:hypothetical protein